MSARNLVPSSTDAGSPSSTGAGGTVDGAQMLHGQVPEAVIVIVTPPDGVSMLPLSSYERLLMFADPVPLTTQLNDQFDVPVARVQVTPPLVDTSTPDSRPPPDSAAVPVMVIGVPAVNEAPLAGAVIVEVGGAMSVDAVV